MICLMTKNLFKQTKKGGPIMNPYNIKHNYEGCDYPHTHADTILCWCEPVIVATPMEIVVLHLNNEPKQLMLSLED